MEWTKVYAQNFLSFEEIILDLKDRGIVLVEGVNLTSSKFRSNGSGKSSLLEPILYGAYDTTSKGLKADDIINRQVGKNTVVILEGTKGKDKYRIERYRKHTKHKNKVKLFCNNEEITAKSAADTNKMIQDLIGVDYNTFVNSIMFSQGSGAGRFAIATDKEKKEILENLVNLQIYVNAQEIAKNRAKAKQAEIDEKKREIERLDWDLSNITSREQEDQQRYQTTKNMIEQEEQSYLDKKEEMEQYIQTQGAVKLQLIDEVTKLQAELEKVSSVNVANPHQERVDKLTQALNICRNKKSELTYQQNEIVKKYQQLKTNTNCPVCGNLLDEAHREKEMAELKEQLRPIVIELNNTNQTIEQFEAAYNETYQLYAQVKADQDNVVSEYRALTNQIATKEQQIQQYSNQLEAYRTQLSNIQGTINKLKNVPEPTPRENERLSIQEKKQALREQMLALEKDKTKLENTVKIFSNSGVKSHVLDLVTPFLNEQGNKYLAMLSGPDMELTFSTQTPKKDGEMTEKFDVKLTNSVGGDNYKANSEGEKKRADISIALALQDLVMSRAESPVNFVVYDEVFDALDSVGAENVVTLLKERQKTIKTIFVITHSEHLKPLFDKTITVTKNKNGISTLDEGEKTT